MSRYLFAAEADQIQDFVFRASRLREVVGGSQLLSRFCWKGAPELLRRHGGDPDQDVVVNDGGAFRLLFDSENDATARAWAHAFGGDLAELYRRCAGGNLTVGEPASCDSGFQQAASQAQEKLSDMKSRGDICATAVHMPYLAFCASCGVAIATERRQRHTEELENYCCSACRQKEQERDDELRRLQAHGDTSGFLGRFLEAVGNACHLEDLRDVPDEFPEDTDDVAAVDLKGRRYVAYLLADGNDMGKQFSACPDYTTMRGLSEKLPGVLRSSLAAPCPHLLRRVQENTRKENTRKLPVLPLILGGDDLFALLPASWAIDFAARFCREYERRMKATLVELGLAADEPGPTIAAAVVICKGNYPHTLAHRQGEELLKEAKELARGMEVHPDSSKRARVSVLNFALITGNEVGRRPRSAHRTIRATARPYFLHDSPGEAVPRAGLSIQALLTLRLQLAELPSKRRAELEALYEGAEQLGSPLELADRWKPRLGVLLKRMGRRGGNVRQAVEDCLRSLGAANETAVGHWRFFDRPFSGGFHGSGLPDLLTIWDYAYDVEKETREYRE